MISRCDSLRLMGLMGGRLLCANGSSGLMPNTLSLEGQAQIVRASSWLVFQILHLTSPLAACLRQ